MDVEVNCLSKEFSQQIFYFTLACDLDLGYTDLIYILTYPLVIVDALPIGMMLKLFPETIFGFDLGL